MAVERNLPFLGICRGCQVINVALGGTLFTDIEAQKPDALKHDWFPHHPRDHRPHALQVEPGSLLSGLLGADNPQVNSLHHQGIDLLAPALKASAHAPDSLVEALELPGHPFGLGVQWHPEWLPDDPTMRALFEGLIQSARSSPRNL
jgi:putative glutamine amidotransferase